MNCALTPLVLAAAVLLASCGGSAPQEPAPPAPAPAPAPSLPAADLNDVSILLPLPAPALMDQPPSPNSLGNFGPLLPPDAQALLPALDPFRANTDVLPAMRVVAVRLDPCMRGMVGVEGCQAQVRLVLQPLRVDAGAVLAEDVALHAFYRLTVAEFTQLLQAVRAWRVAHDGAPRGGMLQVHPALATAGWGSAAAQQFRQLLLGSVGSERLQRLTFMQLQGLRNQWRFGGFDRVGSTWQPITIPHAGGTAQTFTNILVHSDLDFNASLTPPARPADDFSLVFNSSQAIAASPAALSAAHAATLRVDNPLKHDTRSMDCVSCHTASSARAWLQRQGVGGESPGDRFPSLHPLGQSGGAFKPAMLRAFGYFAAEPMISQRTVNETADVLHRLQGADWGLGLAHSRSP